MFGICELKGIADIDLDHRGDLPVKNVAPKPQEYRHGRSAGNDGVASSDAGRHCNLREETIAAEHP